MIDFWLVSVAGFGVICYVIVYATFVLYVVLDSLEETRLVRRYEKKKGINVTKSLVIVGFILCIAFVYAFIYFL